ncbi:MAG: hypothetical protein ACRETL_04610, partial [Gammaproteobacteria bacterium]
MGNIIKRLRNTCAIAIAGLAVVITAAAAQAGTITYGYDPAGRLTTTNYAADSVCTNYSHDAAGNRTT